MHWLIKQFLLRRFSKIFPEVQYGCQTTWHMMVIFNENPVQISSIKWKLTILEILANVDLKNNWWLTSVRWYENSVWNFKSIGLKFAILEIRPMLTFWLMLTSKIIGSWIQWPNVQILFKFQVNRMKIEDFRKLADVDLKRVIIISQGHVTCGKVSISSTERF